MPEDPNDEGIGFFNSLLPYVEQLTPRQKLQFRMDVQKYLFDILFSSEQQAQTRSVSTTQLQARTEQVSQFHTNQHYTSQPVLNTNDFQSYQQPPSSISTNEIGDQDTSNRYTNL